MSYKELSKVYYRGEQEYAEEYRKRFNSEDAVKLDFYVKDRQAFFLQNADVMKLAYKIAKEDKAISKLSEALPGAAIHQYSKKCLIDEIVVTNKIEGVRSSRKEIGDALDILEQQVTAKKRHPRFIGLVNKYFKLMSAEQVSLSTCKDIRNIYNEIVLEEVREENPNNVPDGELFRKDATSIYNGAGKEIHKGLFPESKIIESLTKALSFLNDSSVEKLFRVCIFHFLIEYIHPFYDGNGRLGRFILSYCISDTLEPLMAYRISETIKENLNPYFKAFEICNDAHNLGDLTPFLLMQLNMLYMAATDLRESLDNRRIQWNRYRKIVPTLPDSAKNHMCALYDVLIQAALFSEFGINAKQLSEHLEVSVNTVRRMLDKIPDKLLIKQQKSKTYYYQIEINRLDDMILENQSTDQT